MNEGTAMSSAGIATNFPACISILYPIVTETPYYLGEMVERNFITPSNAISGELKFPPPKTNNWAVLPVQAVLFTGDNAGRIPAVYFPAFQE